MILAGGVAIAQPVARKAPPGFDLRYAMQLAGLQVASIALTVAPQAEATSSRLVIASEGLAALLGRNVTRMDATTRPGDRPDSFTARYEKPDRTRDVAVAWDSGGSVSRAVEIRRGRERPSEVPAEVRSGTIDPLTAVLRLRRWLAEPATVAGAVVGLAVFDGRKRFDLEARRLDDRIVGGAALPRLEARLIPRFGFDARDGYLSWPGQPPRWFEVLVSADGRLAPLAIAEAGQPLIIATHDCTGSGCRPLPPP